MLNALLTAEVRPRLDAVKFFEPGRLTLRSLKVARPDALVVWVRVPLSVPVPVVSASVMFTPDMATLLPFASCTWTVTGGVIVAPDLVLLGC
jgi:hypothetical protein